MINQVHSSAGVYTSVEDYSIQATPLASSVVGMCGMARRGKINERVPVRGADDLENIFGKRDPKFGPGLYLAEPITEQTNTFTFVRLVNKAKYAVAVMTVDDPLAVDPIIRVSAYVDSFGLPVGIEDLNVLGFMADDLTNDNVIGYFVLENPGEWNNEYAVAIRPNNPRGLDAKRDRNLYDCKQFNVDLFQNYVVGSVASQTIPVTLRGHVDEFNRQYQIDLALENETTDLRFLPNPYFEHDLDFVTSDFSFFQGGDDGERVTSDQIAKAYTEYFGDPEEVRVTILVNGWYDDYIVHRGMVLAANNHINCHCIASIPSNMQTVNKAIRYRKQILNINNKNMSLYTSDIKVFDEHTGRKLWIPCTGQVAAAYCLTDNERGSWFAPAGIRASRFLRILEIRVRYDQDDRDALTREQINYIRKLPQGGYAIWEASTLYNYNSAFQMVPIQRMVGFILETCATTAKANVFDPNDEQLREYLKAIIENFLEDIKLRRGLRSIGDSEGYVVVCDERNNTNQTIANGDLVIDLILDPTRYTKRIIYRFNVNPKGSRVTDIVA